MYPELNRVQQDEVVAAVLETAKQLFRVANLNR